MNKRKMAKSESEVKKMTKAQLKQWLTKHDQKLPPQDQLKPFYLTKALKYFQQIQKSNHKSSLNARSRSKKKKTILSPARTRHKRKSLSPSPSLNRSKKRVIKLKRKTPTKQSPSLSHTLKKKRERMRRATADPVNLSKLSRANEDSEKESSDEDVNIEIRGGSENGGDIFNRSSRSSSASVEYMSDTQIQTMTVSMLQSWLLSHNISFLYSKKKKVYVDLVKRQMKKRNLSPNHKKYNSPKFKKIKAKNDRFSSPNGNAPLPKNIIHSPLTPNDDDRKSNKQMSKNRKSKERSQSNSLLHTPGLNRKGVSRIDTPSKMEMRDEIRSLLEGDDVILRPVGVTAGADDGITPGGPSTYDESTMNEVLSDLRRKSKDDVPQHKPRRRSMEPIIAYNPNEDYKQNSSAIKRRRSEGGLRNSSFLSSIINKFSPVKSVSPMGKQKQVSNALGLSVGTKKRKLSRANRTVPSPLSPQEFANVSNTSEDSKTGHTPINNYQQSLAMNESNDNGYFEAEPMSPAISTHSQQIIDQSKMKQNVRRSKRFAKQKKQIKPIQNRVKVAAPKPTFVPSESPGITPSIIPNNFDNKLPFEIAQQNKPVKSGRKWCKPVLNVLLLAVLGFGIAFVTHLFIENDGMTIVNEKWEELTEFIDNYTIEDKKIVFCDNGKSGKCHPCPKDAKFCNNGLAQCKSNYILEEDKCVLDGVVVKTAYDFKRQILKTLSESKGRFECGESGETVDDYAMNEDELVSELSVFDESKRSEGFAYFKQNILPEMSTLAITKKGQFFSYKSLKPPLCRLREWAVRQYLWIGSTVVVVLIVLGWISNAKRKQWRKVRIDAMISEIYNILEEFNKFNKQRYVPIDVIKQRIKPKSHSIWTDIETLLQKDINIIKSIRMIDGMQKRCLALSSIQTSSNNATNQNMYKSSNWSPSQPRTQTHTQTHSSVQGQSWNFNTNQNNNNGMNRESDGFHFMRSDNNNHFDNEQSEPTQFPPHSRRSMF